MVSGWTLSSITPVENGSEDTTSGDISSIDVGARTATITVANGEDWIITFINDEVVGTWSDDTQNADRW